jgi:uncharacterized protein YjbI with pentapeptide repeats
MNDFEQHEQESKRMRWEYKYHLRIIIGIVILSLGFIVGWTVFIEKRIDYLLSLCTNALGIGVGVFILDQRAQQREESRFKADLIYKLGSRINPEAIRAAEELKRHGWLTDGSLKGINLNDANLRNAHLEDGKFAEATFNSAKLQNVDLRNADLQKSWWIGTKLEGAQLARCNLEEAKMAGADLSKVSLKYANLRKADLPHAPLTWTLLDGTNFQEANLMFAQFDSNSMYKTNLSNSNLCYARFRRTIMSCSNLRGANLLKADFLGAWLNDVDLEGANLELATFDDETTLPDGIKWSPSEDMKRFTDPTHVNFWRSANAESAAFRDL